MRRKVLIVGGGGFLGRKVAHALLVRDYDVAVLDDYRIKPAGRLDERARIVYGDAARPGDILEALRFPDNSSVDVVVFLAARQGYSDDWSDFGATNVATAYAFFEAVQKHGPSRIQKVVLASSQAVYTPGLDRREGDQCWPPSVYGLSKLEQERAFLAFGRMLCLRVVALRYSIILGDGQSTQSTESGILRNWWRRFVDDKPPQVYGSGEHIRDFVHVDDAAEATVLAIESDIAGSSIPFERFNVTGPSASIIDVARGFQKLTASREPEILGHDVRPGGEYSMTSSSEKTFNSLGWGAKRTIAQMMIGFIRQAAQETPLSDETISRWKAAGVDLG